MTTPDFEFSHERLDVYRTSIEFLALAFQLTAGLPRGHAAIADQLRRASQSIPLNIAEGCGRPRGPDAARHHGIARGSALECAAALDVLRVLNAVKPERLDAARGCLVRIVRMLSKMCR